MTLLVQRPPARTGAANERSLLGGKNTSLSSACAPENQDICPIAAGHENLSPTARAVMEHPLAGIFPILEGEPLLELAGDILANGLHEPIVLYEDKILDGRNRYRACLAAGVEPRFETYNGSDPLAYVVSLNLKRRHLDESQRAMVAARIATLQHGQRQSGQLAAVPTQAEAAAMLNVGERSVRRAHEVIAEGVPELPRPSIAARLLSALQSKSRSCLRRISARSSRPATAKRSVRFTGTGGRGSSKRDGSSALQSRRPPPRATARSTRRFAIRSFWPIRRGGTRWGLRSIPGEPLPDHAPWRHLRAARWQARDRRRAALSVVEHTEALRGDESSRRVGVRVPHQLCLGEGQMGHGLLLPEPARDPLRGEARQPSAADDQG
jgi:hypothetical protein